MRFRLPIFLALVLSLAGCKGGSDSTAPPKVASFPELGQGTTVGEGIQRFEVKIPTDGESHRLWVYLPTEKQKDMPLILIGPAGSPLIYGMALGDGDVDEHLPYATAGFAVVAYDISGGVQDHAPESEVVAAAKAFKDSEGGVNDAKIALDYAFAKLSIDKKRVYTAGHSSAATLSMQVAARDPRITGCVAYAPVTDIPKRLGDALLANLDSKIGGFSSFIKDVSPSNNVDKLKCRTFIFQAEDDGNVPIADTERFVEALKKSNQDVTFKRVPTGGHYDAMIREGIADAIQWLRGK